MLTKDSSYLIMGVVNATPDSFSDGGRYLDPEIAIAHALGLAGEGADILDIGGESTRPGAIAVDVDEECTRVIPVIEGLAGKTTTLISIDSRKPEVALAAVKAGATIWNDVSALTFSPKSIDVAVSLGCHVVLMHAQGDPTTMQNNPYYDDVVEDVYAFLESRIEACLKAGVTEEKLIVDPGIGFGKKLEHNLALLAHLDRFSAFGLPVMLGASRKRFIGAVDRDGPADDRLGGGLAALLAGFHRGARIFRVHDVAETRQALKVSFAIETAMKRPS